MTTRQLPMKRWTFAGVAVIALLLAGPAYKKYHKPGPTLAPSPIAMPVTIPEPAKPAPAFIDDEKVWPTPLPSPLKASEPATPAAPVAAPAPAKKKAAAPAKKKRRK